jgi:hypothetical protein
MASWNPNAITFADNTTIDQGTSDIFINTKNTIYVPSYTRDVLMVWLESSIPSMSIGNGSLLYPLNVFVTSNDDIYVYSSYDDENGDDSYRALNENHVKNSPYGIPGSRGHSGPCRWVWKSWWSWWSWRCSEVQNPSENNNNKSQIGNSSNNSQNSSNGADNQRSHYGRVYKLSLNATNRTVVMNINGSCVDLFVDINNTIYCSMGDHHRVVKKSLNTDNNTLTIAAGNGSNGSASYMLNYPFGIFVSINFDLYVADSMNHRIQRFQPGDLNGTTVAGNEAVQTINLVSPTGIVLDVDQWLFIVDTGNHRIVKSGPNGFQCIVGCSEESGAASNQLFHPTALSFDSYGNMFVVDTGNVRIQKFILATNSCGKCQESQ